MKLLATWMLVVGILGTALVFGCTADFSTHGSTCGDDAVHGEEVCDGVALDGQTCEDFGFYVGALSCAPDCQSFNTDGCSGFCGDGSLGGPEVCDGTRLGSEGCQSLDHYPGLLLCAGDCAGYDMSLCGGTCGDGVINGPELCDGTAVGATLCSDQGPFYGGPVGCASDCLSYDTGNCWIEPRVLLNEIYVGNPDWVELHNISEVSVQLSNWELHWYVETSNGGSVSGVWRLPWYNIAAGERVRLIEDTSIGANPPVVSGSQIRFGHNIAWAVTAGAAVLLDNNDEPKDFVRWGSAAFDPPVGDTWVDDQAFLPSPGTRDATVTLSRVSEGSDTNSTSDWCITEATPGLTNATVCWPTTAQSTLLISEIQRNGASNDWHVELHNPGATPVNLDGWSLHRGNTTVDPIYLAPFSLGSGQYVELVDDAGGQNPNMNGGIMHIKDLGSATQIEALSLLTPVDYACIDFVRWGGSNNVALAPGLWFDTPTPLPNLSTGESLGRVNLTDADVAGDWCVLQASSFGASNGVCSP